MDTFFISDLHFSDTGILNYEHRPFKDTNSMNREIISRWNRVVKSSDTVYVLGDVGSPAAPMSKFLSEMNGRKMLVMGNHDRHLKPNEWVTIGFDFASPLPIIIDGFYILSHEPVYLNKSMPYANIHGHLHSCRIEGAAYLNVSAELLEYTPISFDGLKLKVAPDSVDSRVTSAESFRDNLGERLKHSDLERIRLASELSDLQNKLKEIK